ncbi:MAG: LysM peptidoglycan-binding domain-containing protein [Bacteroidota bacterium]|nr:LysM peptidoglycan-binding domain-containing protein [Bacteroidota bacterium]
MAIQDKYRAVIDSLNQSGGRNVSANEEGGVLKLSATVKGPKEKNEVWNKIKQIGGENPSDISADITMDSDEDNTAAAPTGVSAKGLGEGKTYVVKSGDTLSKISKEFYGDAGKYMDIAKANNISNPDKIDVGQELNIP